jgi:hypothetical protein
MNRYVPVGQAAVKPVDVTEGKPKIAEFSTKQRYKNTNKAYIEIQTRNVEVAHDRHFRHCAFL